MTEYQQKRIFTLFTNGYLIFINNEIVKTMSEDEGEFKFTSDSCANCVLSAFEIHEVSAYKEVDIMSER